MWCINEWAESTSLLCEFFGTRIFHIKYVNWPCRPQFWGSNWCASPSGTSNTDIHTVRVSHDSRCPVRRQCTHNSMVNSLSPTDDIAVHPSAQRCHRHTRFARNTYFCIWALYQPTGCTLCPNKRHSIHRKIHSMLALFRISNSSMPAIPKCIDFIQSHSSFTAPDGNVYLIRMFHMTPAVHSFLW